MKDNKKETGNIFGMLGVTEKESVESWKGEWQGMPEFIQEKKEEYSKIIFRFDNEKDLQEFATLIGQKLTNKTKSAWYPQLVRGMDSNKVYVDIDDNVNVPNLFEKFNKK
jgi:hypothetical protein